jgi:hypothetical protein
MAKKRPPGQWTAYQPWTGGPVTPTPGMYGTYKPPAIKPITANFTGVNPTFQTPNFAALVAGDPDYESAEAEFNQANQFDRGSLRDAIRRAVIESGLEVGQDEDIDAGTIAAARANQFSSAADIQNQLRKGAATSDAGLAARGLLSSGQFTENRSVLQKGADTARNTLQSALLNQIQSGRNQYVSTVADRRMQLRGIKESIAARLSQNPGIWQQQQTPAQGAAAPGAAYGYGPGGTTVGETAYERALRLRSEGLNKQYGLGQPAAAPAGGAPQIVRYGWEGGVQYGYDAAGRRYTAAQLGGRF